MTWSYDTKHVRQPLATLGHNFLEDEIYKKDQLTNVIQSDYDTGGRTTHIRVTTLTTGDGAVRRISLTYDSQSRVSTVTQYDNATVGSGSVVDEVKYTYDNWGPISKFEQDRNSAVGTGSDQYYVSYAYSKAGAGAYNSACTRRTIRKDTMKCGYGPSTDQATLTYEYLSTSGLHDDDLSRVTRVKLSTTALATYAYNGVSELVGTKYPEIDVWTLAYDPASLASFRDLDRFNRVAVSRWSKDLSTDVDFYNVSLAYDRNGNIIRAEDSIQGGGGGYDVEYTNDSLNRLTKAEEGSWNGSAITSRSRQQIWTLTQTGNWDRAKLDLNGDNDFVDSGETDDTRTHNAANELTARDTDSNSSNNYTLTYDDDGQLTDDGQSYKYVYDAFGRIRQVKNQSNTVIADYTYNGLGYRLSARLDTDNNGDSDSNDKRFHACYDERWRQVATFRESDSSPKEQFVNHQAGLDGSGGASYIDTVICREKDANTAWTSVSDGTLEERRYYCQNWRADVSAVLTSGGLMVEWVKYSSYGSPFGLPGGDTNSDGDCDAADVTQVGTWIAAPAYDVRGDVNLSGTLTSADTTILTSNYQGTTLGWNNLSAIGNRKGYAGYEWESQTGGYHVRHRYLRPDLGRWIRRDPLGYVDGMGLYEYAKTKPLTQQDPLGLAGESISIYCRDVENFILATHCYLVCNKSDGTSTTYSLLNDDGSACKHKDDPRDTEGTYRTSHWGDTGLCDCIERTFQANSGCYEYKATNCNSNWFVASLYKCCTAQDPLKHKDGDYPGGIGFMRYDFAGRCCRPGIGFTCNGPGSGMAYTSCKDAS